MKKFLSALLILPFLSACAADTALTGPGPDLTFASEAVIPLDVASVEVVDAYQPPLKDPNVEHQFAVTPAAAARNLINQRISAAGASGVLRVTIQDARVIGRKLPVNEGVTGTFSRAPSEVFDASMTIRFELQDSAGIDTVKKNAEIVTHRSKMVRNGDTLAEKERLFAELTADVMKDVSSGLDTIVVKTFGRK